MSCYCGHSSREHLFNWKKKRESLQVIQKCATRPCQYGDGCKNYKLDPSTIIAPKPVPARQVKNAVGRQCAIDDAIYEIETYLKSPNPMPLVAFVIDRLRAKFGDRYADKVIEHFGFDAIATKGGTK